MRAARLLVALALFTMPAAAQERQWGFQTTEDDAFLMFGVPDTDDVGLSLWCRLQSGRISLFVPVVGKAREGQRLPLRLDLGGRVWRLPARLSRDDASGRLNAEADLRPITGITRALARAQVMKLRINGRDTAYPLGDADIPGLLAACARP